MTIENDDMNGLNRKGSCNAERRVALEVYETAVDGSQPRLEVLAFEQFVSDFDEENVIQSTKIGSCIGIIFNRKHALNNSFNITTQNHGFQMRTFVQCVYDESGKLLPSLVEPARNPVNEPPPADAGSAAANRELIGEHSFILVERIAVSTAYRRQGIGSQMLRSMLTDALETLPHVGFAVSWPCASDVDCADMGFPPGARVPAGRGQQRAEDFHHAMGFRRLGLTRFWAKALR
ncbi:hypothetical protein UCRNP2_3817 [Neofusicoccum parvum UCRNP2]|uniref:N-acetyltransferase domain-containing protein n=2 Tax=Neofusicoccum parvum TaxID=310453 RepID=R1GME0_BOTPV|nr:hypothetical protein UCRNP2_3817 [Neofusicoccum parvum UCRNP2]GME43270.1 hypothetical protein GTA08_BOTSDO12210 [Neofusicoccum parvum]